MTQKESTLKIIGFCSDCGSNVSLESGFTYRGDTILSEYDTVHCTNEDCENSNPADYHNTDTFWQDEKPVGLCDSCTYYDKCQHVEDMKKVCLYYMKESNIEAGAACGDKVLTSWKDR